jgi:hypothetical protein
MLRLWLLLLTWPEADAVLGISKIVCSAWKKKKKVQNSMTNRISVYKVSYLPSHKMPQMIKCTP